MAPYPYAGANLLWPKSLHSEEDVVKYESVWKLVHRMAVELKRLSILLDSDYIDNPDQLQADLELLRINYKTTIRLVSRSSLYHGKQLATNKLNVAQFEAEISALQNRLTDLKASGDIADIQEKYVALQQEMDNAAYTITDLDIKNSALLVTNSEWDTKFQRWKRQTT